MTEDRRPQPNDGAMGYPTGYPQFGDQPTDHHAPYRDAGDQPYAGNYDYRYDGGYDYAPAEGAAEPAGGGYPGYGDGSDGGYHDPDNSYQYAADDYRYSDFQDPARTEFFSMPAEPAPLAYDRDMPTGHLIDLSVPRAAPVTHRGRRRHRATVLTVVAIAVVIAGGTGYAVLRPTGSGTSAATAAPGTTDPATTEAPFETGSPSVPVADPVRTSPSASASATATPSATATGDDEPITAPTTVPTTVPTTATPRASHPFVVPTTVAPSPAADRPLTATVGFNSDDTGLVGTVRVDNPGTTAVSGFTVRITAPGGDVTVRGGDVSATRSGDAVTFRGTGSVAAGGSVTFTFVIEDPAGSAPSGCTVDGNACS